MNQAKEPLPPRDYVVEFNVRTDAKESGKKLKLQGCPGNLKNKFKELVTDYWYIFYEEGLRRPIWVFSSQIGTGNNPPICCKLPRYGTHESDVIQNLVGRLDEIFEM